MAQVMVDYGDIGGSKYNGNEFFLSNDNGLVPQLSANNSNIISSGHYGTADDFAEYKAFDRSDGTRWASPSGQANGAYLGYKFDTPQVVKVVNLSFAEIWSGNIKNFVVEASDDGEWKPMSKEYELRSVAGDNYYLINPKNEAYTQWRIKSLASRGGSDCGLFRLQFY